MFVALYSMEGLSLTKFYAGKFMVTYPESLLCGGQQDQNFDEKLLTQKLLLVFLNLFRNNKTTFHNLLTLMPFYSVSS